MEILEHVEEIETEDDLGYVITTSENIYTILIANYLNWCEDFGISMMPGDCLDNVAELYGATVYTVNTDVLCRGDGGDVDDAMFLNLSTSKGDLTFTCYNKHNGYYSHSATVTRIDRNSSDLSKTGEVLLSDFL